MFIRVVCNNKCILDIVHCLEFSSDMFWKWNLFLTSGVKGGRIFFIHVGPLKDVILITDVMVVLGRNLEDRQCPN
jgi:hypothetical protein